jgi:Acetyltransferase (GNAT) domain
MNLEFYRASELSPLLLREIGEFLDSQNTSHLFQFPQWNSSTGRCALLRESEFIRWFATFGMHAPMGSACPWMRAVSANRGPVCDDHDLWASVTEEFAIQMRRENFTYFEVSPDWVQRPESNVERGFCGPAWERLNGGRASLRLDLTRSEDEIFAGFRKNSRYEIRRAEREGVSVVSASVDSEIDEFLTLYSRMASRKGFLAEAPGHLQCAIDWLIGEESRGALLLARRQNTICGGAVIGRSGRRCWYVWGSADRHDHFNVGHLLQWKALLWARSHGCDEYDFGGYTPGAKSGPAWFKAGFGGTLVRFVPPHRKVFQRRYYGVFKFAFRVRQFGTKLQSESRKTSFSLKSVHLAR